MEDKLELLGQIKFINTLEKHPKQHQTWPDYLDDIRFDRELGEVVEI